eukprot:Plantae.Rhodophyta-Hildenbrandia_rubra.ctg6092.p1 GENE.Plantae.Rhodophyta-Hildenbrandia_rubra.ctg6092~~Plantae.Rhodophyta-Hildenbrandia_rubra.ctg6092.p1  ORF type:complete len:419 (-),score=55.00 Plantae.Rhodophyta-Hildenbrandia_rubra.ctg6092:32-1288(-)
MRKDLKLCDAALLVEGRVFDAHRAVLAAASPFFSAMFTNGMRESKSKPSDRIPVSDVDKKSFELVLDFVYSGEVVFESKDEALLLLKAADMLQLCDLVRLLENEILPLNLELDECVDLWDHADYYGLHTLQKVIMSFLEENFEAFVANSSLRRCSWGLLFLLLESDDAMIGSEKPIVYAIVEWINFDKTRRSVYFESALSMIRLSRMNSKDLMEVAHWEAESSFPDEHSSDFRKALIQRLHRQSQKEALMGIAGAFRSSLHLKALSPLCRRDQIPIVFAQELENFSSETATIYSSWIIDPEGSLGFRFSVDPRRKVDDDEKFYLSAFLNVERQDASCKDCSIDLSKLPYRVVLVSSCEDESIYTRLLTNDFSSSGWGTSKLCPRDKCLSEENGYYTKKLDSITVAGLVLVPLSSLKDD